MGNGVEPLRFAIRSGRRYSKLLLRVPLLSGKKDKVVPVLKTPFSEPEWQDPEFLRKVRGLEGMLRVCKSLEGTGGCASSISGWSAAENVSGGQLGKPASGTMRRENVSGGQLGKPASGTMLGSDSVIRACARLRGGMQLVNGGFSGGGCGGGGDFEQWTCTNPQCRAIGAGLLSRSASGVEPRRGMGSLKIREGLLILLRSGETCAGVTWYCTHHV